jgi:hypothetical protein
MPVKVTKRPGAWIKRLRLEIGDGWEDDLSDAANAGADAIVETTLNGIGENDQKFVPYSESYRKQLERARVQKFSDVDLRGVFYKSDTHRTRRGSRKVEAGSVRQRRTRAGIYDYNSEMSRHLISVVASGTSVVIRYEPDESNYMNIHNEGIGKMPRRRWFTLNKTAVQGAIWGVLREAWHDRIDRINGVAV